jgi:hypothetical protein
MGKYSLSAAAMVALASLLAACSSGGATPAVLASPTANPASMPGFYQCAPLVQPAPNGPGAFDGGDGLLTVQKGPLTLGDSGCSSTVTDLEIAENWTFQGTVNQIITINVKALGDADPQITLIDPIGDAIDMDDDSGGGTSARLNALLEMDGIYTLRVELFEPGVYTINVLQGTPEPEEQIEPAAP